MPDRSLLHLSRRLDSHCLRRTVRNRLLRFEHLEQRATPAGLVAAFSFDEGTGSIVGDASGNGHAGTISGAAWEGAGWFGSALSFDGVNDLVTIGDANDLDLTTNMTLMAWVRPTEHTGSDQPIILKDGGGELAYAVYVDSQNGRPSVEVRQGSTYYAAVGTSQLPLNVWTHVAATYDGANLRLYVNGTQAASLARSGPLNTTAGALLIGGKSAWNEWYAGLIDEVRIYDRALSPNEIIADMNAPVEVPPVDTEPPTVSINSPNSGDTVSHVAILSSEATDNLAIANVEFYVDGASVGIDSVAPYSVNWDTTAVANVPHVITAVARDHSGNQTTSDPVNVSTLNPAFVNEIVVPDVFDATTIAFLPDGRMLVGELSNKVLMVQPGANEPNPQPLLDLGYAQQFGEQGLMDVAVDPNFASNGYIYVYYTKGFSGQQNHNRLSRFTVSGSGVIANSETVLWQDDRVANAEHHGGSIGFGADGKIYFTTGDEFSGQAPSQQLDNYWGKVLRINTNGSIPLDNPFYDGAGPNRDEIWAYGLRNPYRMSIDPLSGRMYIGDVGGNDGNTAIEELNLGIAGANYGWPLGEGETGIPGTTDPIFSYAHNNLESAITAGFIYHGSQFPSEYQGSFFFGDYANNTIKRLTLDANGNVTGVVNFWPADGSRDGSVVGDPVKLVEGPDGSLYYVDIGFDTAYQPNPAAIRRIRYSVANQPPVAVAMADMTVGLPPLTVNFSSAGSFDPEGQPLSYLWTFGDGGTSTDANPSHTYLVAGKYTAMLSVSDLDSSTLSTGMSIQVGNPPAPTISTPLADTMFRAGDVISYVGTALDFEDGDLPASAFNWTILFHHESHIHPAGVFSDTTSGTLTIPTTGHDFLGETSYEIVLTVTDSTGLSNSTSVSVYPEKVNLSFDSLPTGLTIIVDGINRQTPFVLDDLISFEHTIAAPIQSSGGVDYTFWRWSDGGSQTHNIVVPSTDQSYLALFAPTSVQLPGDYNGDDTVNAADYSVWRNTLGTSTILLNDVTPGSVTVNDYSVWKVNYGATTLGTGAAGNAFVSSSPTGSVEFAGVADPTSPDDSSAAAVTGATDRREVDLDRALDFATLGRAEMPPVHTIRAREIALSQSGWESLLLTRLRHSIVTTDRGQPVAGETRVASERACSQNPCFDALDDLFAEFEALTIGRLT